MLISCPGDVAESDRGVIHRSVNRWNFNYGRHFQLTILPIWWGENASGEFGQHPQDVINAQLVDDADIALAVFWTRLGTESDRALSGTAEEIERMAKAGKTVSILQCTRPAPIDCNLEQLAALRGYLKSLEPNALVMSYESDSDLASRIDNLLSRQATIFMAKISDSKSHGPQEDAGVWPSIDFKERLDTSARGLRTRRSHYLVLKNKGSAPARNVTFSLDPDDGMILRGDDQMIDVMAPESEMRFPLALTLGSPRQFNCRVTWRGPDGKEKENVATLRPA
ncbi:hypothetical protein [Streptomyces albogriseolus]|jgi:hypothetical protein|uniref:hypothetical protein n=1 Tax=Streptomyces albogriseolus TaxID=1887 RepID=UPI00224FFBF8|nr:hypothetical protein [Streptomyces viridodiastaticus]MCX4621435.1 hypothetical protein [Streptomyces viridodiastaticus]